MAEHPNQRTSPVPSTCASLGTPPAAAVKVSPAAAGASITAAEMLRLHDGGMGIDKLGAKFRQPYDQINRIIEAEMKRRADAWALSGPSLGCERD